ncbi:MAG: hypothetical protein J6K58_12400 [Lachnospiraceae bacterium]|nr:hypothetical protein [Lachnospiraceae bacterium]
MRFVRAADVRHKGGCWWQRTFPVEAVKWSAKPDKESPIFLIKWERLLEGDGSASMRHPGAEKPKTVIHDRFPLGY